MSKLLRNNVAYAIGGVANSLALFLLIPYLVTALPTAEYGQWSLFEILALFITMVSVAGFDVGMMRHYWATPDEVARRTIIGTVLIGTVAWGTGIATLLLCLSWGLTRFPVVADALNFKFSLQALWVVIAIGVGESWFNLLITVFRIREDAIHYVTLSFLRMVLFLGLAFTGVALGNGVEGALLGRLSATILGILVALFVLKGYIHLKWQGDTWRQVVRYGFPLLPTNIATYILLASDRYFLNAFTSTQTVAIYTFMYKVATTIDIGVIRPFALDWAPRRFKIATRADAEQTYNKVLLLFLWATISCGLLVIAGTDVVYTWLNKTEYATAQPLIPLVLLSFIIYGLSYPLNIGMLLKDRTSLMPPLAWLSAIVCLFLNAWWIPAFGMAGAAWATLASYVVYTTGITIASQKLFPVRYDGSKIIQIVLAALFGFGGIVLIQQWMDAPLLAVTTVKISWVMLVMLLLGYSLFGTDLSIGRAKAVSVEVKQ